MKKSILALFVLSVLFSVGCQSTSTDSAGTTTATTTSAPTKSTGDLPIAYVNTDTLTANYTYFISASKALEEKSRKAQQSFDVKAKKLENEFMAVQKKVQAGELTANQVAQEEKRFARKQQKLGEEQQRMQSELMKETQEVQDTLYSNLKRVLRKYADEHGLQYVLSHTEIGGVLFLAPESADITNDILKILNTEE